MSGESPGRPPGLTPGDEADELYDHAPCGYLTTDADGRILRANATLARWLGRTTDDLSSMTFVELLTPGGRIYHEPHFAPSLRMHGEVREIAVELRRSDTARLPVLVNATLDRHGDGSVRAVRIAVFDATERRSYERELLLAKERAEASEARAQTLARTLQETRRFPRTCPASTWRPPTARPVTAPRWAETSTTSSAWPRTTGWWCSATCVARGPRRRW